MDDDGLEVVDLTPEFADSATPPRRTFRFSRRQVAILVVGVGAVAAIGGLLARDRSGHKAALAVPTTPSSISPPFSLPTTTWVPPAGLTRLASGRFVAVIFGTPILVGDTGPVRKLLGDIPGDAFVDVSQRGAALMHYEGTTRVIVGPTFGGNRNALPAGIALLPDAEGRWWSNFGPLQTSKELHLLRFPSGTTPVAKLRNGYLLVDDARTALLEWRSGAPLARIGNGDARVLAVAGDLVAWASDVGPAVHVANLANGRTIDIPVAFDAVTARFSPDRSRLAMLSGGLSESMVLADPVSGRLITQVLTASGGNGLAAFGDVPAAFEPVPFTWDTTGSLVLIAQTTVGDFVKTIDSVSGSVLRTVAAPEGLHQLISLAP